MPYKLASLITFSLCPITYVHIRLRRTFSFLYNKESIPKEIYFHFVILMCGAEEQDLGSQVRSQNLKIMVFLKTDFNILLFPRIRDSPCHHMTACLEQFLSTSSGKSSPEPYPTAQTTSVRTARS